ncbi:MAG TPA: zinc-binding dehydrogenase [Candidatus Sulfomarinibacteraceae bacterium]|nr:zinc-binding dehydrogenase [Candidatus Sulfomarinibacteraceae bacterium]
MTAGTMRAAELAEPGAPLRLVERPVPEPGPGDVRVRVQACGVCGSDVFLQKGGFGGKVTWPVVPGHEAAGVVDALGEGVTEVAPGDQVALYYITVPGGDPWAARGRPNISPYVTRMGVDVDGAFADYVTRPVAALIRPPAHVPPAILAVLTDAVATPLHGLKRVAHLQPGETLAVLGVGGLGSNAVQLGKAFGARVIAVTRSAAKLELARQLGADEVVPAEEGDPVAAVKALTGGHGPDVVIQCVGSAAVDEQAIAMGGPGGRVVLIGSSLDHFRARAVDIFWRELSVLGSRGFIPDDIRDAIDLYLDGTLTVEHLVDQVRPLAEANEALEDLKAGRGFRTVLTT